MSQPLKPRLLPERLMWWDARHGHPGVVFAVRDERGEDGWGQPVYVTHVAELESAGKVRPGTYAKVEIAHALLEMAWRLLHGLPDEVKFRGTEVSLHGELDEEGEEPGEN